MILLKKRLLTLKVESTFLLFIFNHKTTMK